MSRAIDGTFVLQRSPTRPVGLYVGLDDINGVRYGPRSHPRKASGTEHTDDTPPRVSLGFIDLESNSKLCNQQGCEIAVLSN